MHGWFKVWWHRYHMTCLARMPIYQTCFAFYFGATSLYQPFTWMQPLKWTLYSLEHGWETLRKILLKNFHVIMGINKIKHKATYQLTLLFPPFLHQVDRIVIEHMTKDNTKLLLTEWLDSLSDCLVYSSGIHLRNTQVLGYC